MLYVKRYLPGGIVMEVPLDSNELYTKCCKCKKEVKLNLNDLKEIINKGLFDTCGALCEDCICKELIE